MKPRIIGGLSLVAIVALAMAAWAEPGDLDTSFGDDGIVVTDVGGDDDIGRDLSVDDAGRILVAGDFWVTDTENQVAVLRYLPDGSLDPDFGTDGLATHVGPETEEGASLVIDPDGDVVVAGTSDTGDVAVVRFQSNGAIDSTFGSSGVVNTDLGESERGHAVALDSNDNIVVVGTSLAIPGGSDIFALRYQPDGTLDPSFGTGGVVEFDSGPSENVHDVVVDSDDRILMAAQVEGDTGSDLAVLRYDSGGTLDPDFGDGGIASVDIEENERGVSLGIDAGGRIILAGSTNPSPSQSDAVLARFMPDGSLDPGFGLGGIVVTSLPSGDSVADSVGIDREGRIVISGDVGSTNELAVGRYLPGGTLDSSFGTNGFATTKVGEGQNVGNGLAFDDAGRILMTGMHRESIGEGDLIVVRFEGSMPPTTTTTATSTTTTTTPVDDAFIDDDGSVFEGDIDAVAAAGITRGCNPPANDMYCPDDLVTRGQMAAFLNRALGLPSSSEDAFVDDDGSVFEGDIDAVAAAGITRGCNPPTNDMYCPDDLVTRGQMAAFINRAFLD